MDHNNQTEKVVTRIPPSPTGHLHIGTARTALFNYLFAKKNNGRFLFRSEDTDQQRSSREFEKEIIEGLQWLGIEWDNKEIVRQSEKTEVYTQHLQTLVDNGSAYISREASKQDADKEVEVIRLKNPNKKLSFEDLVRGEVTFDTTELGDFVIARSLDDPLYHFTVVVDDADMEVTHILRGEDHISNTPRQILIQEALGLTRPAYAHLPLILAPDKSKLSKRNGAVALYEYQNKGLLPETLINYLALLGWNPGTEQEFFTLDQLVSEFSIENIQKGGAIFDMQKILWLQKLHLHEKPIEFQKQYLIEALQRADITEKLLVDRFLRMLSTILERYVTLEDLMNAVKTGEFSYLTEQPEVDTDLLQWKSDSTVQAALPRLKKAITLLEDCDFSSPEEIKEAIFPYAEEEGKGEVLWPLRISLTGKKQSADPFSVAYGLQKEETIARIHSACAKIEE